MSKNGLATKNSDTGQGVAAQCAGPEAEGACGGKAAHPERAPIVAIRPVPPDPEVVEKPVRRKFTAEYKSRVLREADACAPGTGELGALLRREGLYSSHLTTWRRQREQAELDALAPKKRGRKAAEPHPLARRVAELERDNARLQRRLQQAEVIIDVQKKLLGCWESP
jgi:transposase